MLIHTRSKEMVSSFLFVTLSNIWGEFFPRCAAHFLIFVFQSAKCRCIFFCKKIVNIEELGFKPSSNYSNANKNIFL